MIMILRSTIAFCFYATLSTFHKVANFKSTYASINFNWPLGLYTHVFQLGILIRFLYTINFN